MKKQNLTFINLFLATVLLTSTVLVAATSKPESNVRNVSNPETLNTPEYDPWCDVDNDGDIDIFDIVKMIGKYGTVGENISKSGVEYDSGWLNITDKAGQYITVAHNLDITNWNDPGYHVEIAAQAITWASTTSLPSLRAQHASVAYNGRIYVLGGWEYAGNDTVYYCDVNPDGTIDSWQETTSLLDRRSETVAVAYNDTIYVLGGQGSGGQLEKNTVWYALINTTDGSVGNWSSTTPLTFQGSGRGAFVWDGRVYVVGGWTGFSFRTDVHFAEINPDGTLGSWTATSSIPEGRGHGVAAVAHNGYAYVLGGSYYSPQKEVWKAKINASDGTVSSWEYQPSIPIGLSTQGVAVVDEQIYVIGGEANPTSSSAVYRASINSDGSIGGWIRDTDLALPVGIEPRAHLIQTPEYNDRIYVIGGTNGTWAPTNTVFFSHLTNNQIGLLAHLRGDTYTPGWNRTYGGTDNDSAYSVVQTSDGGYALAGTTYSFSVGGYDDFWLVKTDAAGNMQWNRTYGGADNDHIYSIVQSSDGGYALAGWTRSFGAGQGDFWLGKTDAAGNMQWNRTYGGASNEGVYSVVQTSDGGYALAGYTNSFGAGGWDFWLVKTNSTGHHQWNRTYGGADYDYAWSIVQTSDGGYTLAGYTRSFGTGQDDFWLVKTNATGNHEWNQTYGGTNSDGMYSMVQTSDGGYALAGWTKSFGTGQDDFWLVKTNATGNHEWNQTYGGTDYDTARSVVQTSDGGYVLAGHTNSFGAGGEDFWLVKTDSAGNMVWNRTYGGTGTDRPMSVIQTNDRGYALAGYTESFGAGNLDFWLIKTEVESGLAWTGSTSNTIALYRGISDLYWNYVRIRIWKTPEP